MQPHSRITRRRPSGVESLSVDYASLAHPSRKTSSSSTASSVAAATAELSSRSRKASYSSGSGDASHGVSATSASSRDERSEKSRTKSKSRTTTEGRKVKARSRTSSSNAVLLDDFLPGPDWWNPVEDLHSRDMLSEMQLKHLEWQRLRDAGAPTRATDRNIKDYNISATTTTSKRKTSKKRAVATTSDVQASSSTLSGGPSTFSTTTAFLSTSSSRDDFDLEIEQNNASSTHYMKDDSVREYLSRNTTSTGGGGSTSVHNYGGEVTNTKSMMNNIIKPESQDLEERARRFPQRGGAAVMQQDLEQQLEVGVLPSSSSSGPRGFGRLQPDGGHALLERWRSIPADAVGVHLQSSSSTRGSHHRDTTSGGVNFQSHAHGAKAAFLAQRQSQLKSLYNSLSGGGSSSGASTNFGAGGNNTHSQGFGGGSGLGGSSSLGPNIPSASTLLPRATGSPPASPDEAEWHQLPSEAVQGIQRWRAGQIPGRLCLLLLLDSVFGQEPDDGNFAMSGEDEMKTQQGSTSSTADVETDNDQSGISNNMKGSSPGDSETGSSSTGNTGGPSALMRTVATSTGFGTGAALAQRWLYERVFALPPLQALDFAFGFVRQKTGPGSVSPDALCLACRQIHLQLQDRPFRERLMAQILAELIRAHVATCAELAASGSTPQAIEQQLVNSGGFAANSAGMISGGPQALGAGASSATSSSGASGGTGSWTDLAVCDLLAMELGLTQYNVEAECRGAAWNSIMSYGAGNADRYKFKASAMAAGAGRATNGFLKSTFSTPGLDNASGGGSSSSSASSGQSSTSNPTANGGVPGGSNNSTGTGAGGAASNNNGPGGSSGSSSSSSGATTDISLEQLRVQNNYLEQYVIKTARIRDDLKGILQTLQSVDAYETLGVARASSLDEVKKAFHKLARTMHPDKGGSPRRFQAIQKAYSCIQQQRQDLDKNAEFKLQEVNKEDGACLEPEELERKMAQLKMVEDQVKLARKITEEASERANACADFAHQMRQVPRSKPFKQMRTELLREVEVCSRLRQMFAQTARAAQGVAKVGAAAMTKLSEDANTGDMINCEFVNATALSDRIRICRDAASSCLVMADSLDKIRGAVLATVEKVESITDGKAGSQSDRMGKKLLVSSSERVEQTGRRAADEAISCAMKAGDVVKGMSALVLEMRDRLKRANRPSEPAEPPTEGTGVDGDGPNAGNKNGSKTNGEEGDEDEDSDVPGGKKKKKSKTLAATTHRLRERHLLLRSKNLSFLSQINDEARECQSLLQNLVASGSSSLHVEEKADLTQQLLEIFDTALAEMHQDRDTTLAKLERHLLFLLHLDTRLAVPTDVRSKVFLMVLYADSDLAAEAIDIFRRKTLQVLLRKGACLGNREKKDRVRDWVHSLFTKIRGNAKRYLQQAGVADLAPFEDNYSAPGRGGDILL
ncbi:unnamed protein product [Amoebophrya sp. A25]|nr:unnamed protein product [Amoebophrya sp. A25]|eukprot:GSA25T00004512001.1